VGYARSGSDEPPGGRAPWSCRYRRRRRPSKNAGDGSASPAMPYSTAPRCSGLRPCRCRQPSVGCSFVFLFCSPATAIASARRGRNAGGSVGKNAGRLYFGARAGRGFAPVGQANRACGLSVLIRSSPRNFRPAEQLEFATSGDGLGPRRPSSLLRKGSRPAMTPCQVTCWSLTPIQL
jgi:hypothetical protein